MRVPSLAWIVARPSTVEVNEDAKETGAGRRAQEARTSRIEHRTSVAADNGDARRPVGLFDSVPSGRRRRCGGPSRQSGVTQRHTGVTSVP